MAHARILIDSLVCDIVTFLTGLPVNTPHMLPGATYHGHLFRWLIQLILAPEQALSNLRDTARAVNHRDTARHW
jgi:hypothetical protein